MIKIINWQRTEKKKHKHKHDNSAYASMGIGTREDNKYNLICNRKIKKQNIYIFVLFFKQRIRIKNCLRFHVRTQRNRNKKRNKNDLYYYNNL